MDEVLLGGSVVVWVGFALYFVWKVARSVRLVPNKTELIVERLGGIETGHRELLDWIARFL